MNDFHFHSDFHQVIVRSRRVRSWAVFPLGTILPASGVWGQLLIASIVQSPMLPNPKPYSDCGTWPICILSCTKTTDTLQRWGYARCDGTCPFSLHGSLSFQKSLLHTASLTSPAAFSRCFSGLAMVGIHCGLSASLSDTPRLQWIPGYKWVRNRDPGPSRNFEMIFQQIQLEGSSEATFTFRPGTHCF